MPSNTSMSWNYRYYFYLKGGSSSLPGRSEVLSKTLFENYGEKKRTVQHINAHHITKHTASTFLKPYFQGTLVEELMENIAAHFI